MNLLHIDIYRLSLRDAKTALMMKNFLGFLLVIVLMSSCGEYQKLLKSGDYSLMYKKAVEYYNKGDYTRALNLFDGIRTVFAGTARAQTIAYYRAFCTYNQKDYENAAELFKQFVAMFPESSYMEECLYMMGYCNYLASPRVRLDQTTTEKAMSNFQLYLSRYPNSTRKELINKYMDDMRDKLSYKAYLGAENYYLREHYKAAVVSLENCLKDFPGTKYRERIMWMLFNSKYEMAVNSVEDKKYECYTAAKEEYYYFVDEYPNSVYAKEMAKKYEVLNDFLKQYDDPDEYKEDELNSQTDSAHQEGQNNQNK